MKFEIAPKSAETRLNWDDARLYCFALTIDGKTGWRLPTKEELNEIYESENDFAKDIYWTSTEYNTDIAWSQGFHSGNQLDFNKSFDLCYVRAIRSTL